ncbi:hypothetical protein BH09ACT1_BH09ACT1_06130 [soil metagenome]
MRRALIVVAAVIALSVVVPSFAPSSAASASPADALPTPSGIGIRLLDVPTASLSDPRASAYIIDNVAPGGTIARRILVENNTDSVQDVRVYAAAATVTGEAFVGSKGKTANELSGWTTPALSTVTIPARASIEDLITIAVPSTATEGERYAAIWAETRSTAASGTDEGPTVTTVGRVGVRVYLSVGAGNGPQSSFTVSALKSHRASDGKAVVTATVKNTGGRAIDISGKLRLTDGPGSLSAGPFSLANVVTLAPGKSGTVSVPLDAGLPRGPWTATIIATSGVLSQTLSASITFPAAGNNGTSDASAGAPVLLIVLGAVALLILIAALVWYLRRRRMTQL